MRYISKDQALGHRAFSVEKLNLIIIRKVTTLNIYSPSEGILGEISAS